MIRKLFLFLMLVSSVVASGGPSRSTVEVHRSEEVVWGFDFIDNNTILFTERPGAIKRLDLTTKQTQILTGVPKVWARGQGGMLDLRVHPKKKNEIFFCYAEPVPNQGAATALATAELNANELRNVRRMFVSNSPNTNTVHFGCRIEFDDTGHLYLSVGDRGERDEAQDLKSHNGKIIRLNLDGTVPKDNPFVSQNNSMPEIWSYGHRSPQGLSFDPATKILWQAEMGPRGGDEINIVEKGKNYGWPVVTFGREYYGPRIGKGTQQPGMEDPEVHWTPSISPSAILLYRGSQYSEWKENLFIATLSGQHLRRLEIKDQKIINQEVLAFITRQRIRNLRMSPSEHIYFSTDDGRIVRIH